MTDYSRLEATDFPHRLMERLTVAVIGAGTLGNAVAQILCLNGTGKLLIVDPETVASPDLSRSLFFRNSGSIGQNKAVALARAAQPLFPDTQIVPFAAEVADVESALLGSATLWFSCVDSLMTRLEIAYLSSLRRRPVVDGGLGADALDGRASWFPVGGACFSCLLPRPIRARLLTDWEASPCGCGAIDQAKPFPSTPSLAAAVAGVQVELGLRSYFESRGDSITARLWTSPCLRAEIVSNSIAELCPFHWKRDFKWRMVSDTSRTVGDFLRDCKVEDGPDPYLVLDWPLCRRAECRACGHIFEPGRRVGLLRKTACAQCGSESVAPIEMMRTISVQNRWAARTFGELGIGLGLVAVGQGVSPI